MKFGWFHFHKFQLTFFIPWCRNISPRPDYVTVPPLLLLCGNKSGQQRCFGCCDRIPNRPRRRQLLFVYRAAPENGLCPRGDLLHNCQSHRKLSFFWPKFRIKRSVIYFLPLPVDIQAVNGLSGNFSNWLGQACHWNNSGKQSKCVSQLYQPRRRRKSDWRVRNSGCHLFKQEQYVSGIDGQN